ncbi:MAG TPA: ribulose-phosphate 3-epimerase [Alphaproteobacteria bacterium]|nr:ribulose-phosphate 3-epimerase [Alphaproteobacteria bacterium]
MLSASLLSADLLHLEDDIKRLQSLGVERFHLDIMDNHYVQNLSFGPDFLKVIRPVIKGLIDVHLMISPVEEMALKFINNGADSICFHPNSTFNPYKTVKLVKDKNTKVGIVLNPFENPFLYQDLIQQVDYVLVMSVNPGHGGQQFLKGGLKTLKDLKTIDKTLECHIDGGVNSTSAPLAVEAGAKVLIAGTALFDPLQQIQLFKSLNLA